MQKAQSVRIAAELACLLEASAEKPGNVTPHFDFRDMRYEDFLRSAVAIGPEMALADQRGVGDTVLAAIQATRRHVQVNTNLGIVLLFAPLAKAALQHSPSWHAADLRHGIRQVLHDLNMEDAQQAYEAIRAANPGGLAGSKEGHNVRTDVPTITLREAMALAAHRDSIASEYVTDYAIVFEHALPALTHAYASGLSDRNAILQTYLQLLASVPDTLIARKCGTEQAIAISKQAEAILASGGPFSEEGRRLLAHFDADLRHYGNRLNPGTSADLIAATLFVYWLPRVGE